MHEVLDTETVDATEELFWPQQFKWILRSEFKSALIDWIKHQNIIKKLADQKPEEDRDFFIEVLADKIIIGGENGADDAFEMVHKAFSYGRQLPCMVEWVENITGKEFFTENVRMNIQNMIADEYSCEHLYEHIFEDYYMDRYSGFADFIEAVSKFAVTGIINGTENQYRKIIQSFIYNIPLPPARRHPMAIKGLL
jgi:hypothetical protein